MNEYLSMMKDFRKLSLNGLQRRVESGGLHDNPRLKDCLRECWTQRRSLHTERAYLKISPKPTQKDGSLEQSPRSTCSEIENSITNCSEALSRKEFALGQRLKSAKSLAATYVEEERSRSRIKVLEDNKVKPTRPWHRYSNLVSSLPSCRRRTDVQDRGRRPQPSVGSSAPRSAARRCPTRPPPSLRSRPPSAPASPSRRASSAPSTAPFKRSIPVSIPTVASPSLPPSRTEAPPREPPPAAAAQLRRCSRARR